MIGIQDTKAVQLVAPQTIGTTAVSGYVDTLGYDHLRVYYIGAAVATGALMSALKLQEGDTTSAFTDISGAVGGTAATGGFIITTPTTSAPDNIIFDVNLAKARKRYVNISITGTATTRTTAVLGVLGRAAVTPDTDAELGAAEVVYV